MSSSSYVVVPRCSVVFDGTNYAEFVGFMCIHMRGLLLWGVLSGELPCPPCPVAPVAPAPPVPPVLAVDASQADRDATKALGDAAVDAYDQQVIYRATAWIRTWSSLMRTPRSSRLLDATGGRR
uniref:Predicted protein n=1 Tax=Hordeum vulgare subsp. vulgare TaxID=112509 RepID=F2D382_HORVV|nr:predicted protein [Hordeum vulgare subsp. vulgare]